MSEENKVIILEKKVPKKIVNLFGNVHSIIRTYDRMKIKQFMEMIDEKTLDFAEKYLDPISDFSCSIMYSIDKFFDRTALKSVGNINMNDNDDFESQNLDAIEEYVEPKDGVVRVKIDLEHVRKINFEDLEPLGQIIDDEDDVYELQELRREILSSSSEDSKQNVGIRKK